MAPDAGLRVDGMDPDDTVLVVGPPMTGKYELFLQVLAGYADRVILISTKNGAETLREDYRSVAGDGPAGDVAVVDCVSQRESYEDVDGAPAVKYVSSPQNLTGIGVRFTEFYSDFMERPVEGGTGVGLHSVSQLLMHVDVKTVYQFLQVLTGQIRSAGWTGVAVVDTGAVDDEDVQVLKHHFDGIVETRENEAGEREFRSRGFTARSSDWRQF